MGWMVEREKKTANQGRTHQIKYSGQMKKETQGLAVSKQKKEEKDNETRSNAIKQQKRERVSEGECQV